jgi:saccharopine dehydrogenase-like NADP-dependent oxidoreductase
MTKVVIIGTGKYSTAVAKILLCTSEHEVSILGEDEDALKEAYFECSTIERTKLQTVLSPTLPLEIFTFDNIESLEATLGFLEPDVIVNASWFLAGIVELAVKFKTNYIDIFAKDSDLSVIKDLYQGDKVFAPQVGLFPGLLSYIGFSLFEDLDSPLELHFRLGTLPQVSFGPAHFSLTEEPEELAELYFGSTLKKTQGEICTVLALDEVEQMNINGVHYECFSTNTPFGDTSAYKNIGTVDFKSIRFPGHLDAIQKMVQVVHSDEYDFTNLVSETFTSTDDDVVSMCAVAIDVKRKQRSASLHFYPCEALNLTARELTTAGACAGVLEMILENKVQDKVLDCSNINTEDFLNTKAMELVFEYMN